MRVQGACLLGADAELVTVEARFEPADRARTEVAVTGLPDPVIRESRGRLESALRENGLGIPGGKLHLNLVPAGRRKAGEILDLPMALAAAAAVGHLDPAWLERALFLGEVGIDGRLHAVPGGLAAASAAERAGIARVIAPRATAEEAACLASIQAYGLESLADVVRFVAARPGSAENARAPLAAPEPRAGPAGGAEALDRIRGHAAAKRALAIAAAGEHALLLIGPPGTGKSMLARALPLLLSPPDAEERLAITRVLSAAGRWPGGLATERPYRAPHHTVSYAGLVGGGAPPAPGEISLAHGGVLFLDELAEMRREVLEALRQPLESGEIAISRAGRQVELPARFQLVAAMNPCMCGYLGHPRVPCRCGPALVQRYRQRISGPLLDRIDLRVEVNAPSVDELALAPGTVVVANGASGEELRAQVAAARERIGARQGRATNARLAADELDRLAPLASEGRRLIEAAARARSLSARAVQSVRRVARTIADLEACAAVTAAHLAEAIALRAPV